MTAGDIKIRSGEHGEQMSGVVINGNDDYIQIDALAVAEASAANVTGTISAWINVPDITGTYAVFCMGDADADERLTLQIAAGKLQGINSDAGVAQWQVTSTNVVIAPHRWHHVCLVHTGGATNGRPYLYVDGVAVAMTDNITTDLTKWTNGLALLDKGCIGMNRYNNLAADDFLGGISYVKYATGIAGSGADWTQTQVKQEYDFRAGRGSGSGVTTGVLCLWTLNGNVTETVTGGGTYDGTISSDVQYDSEYSNMTSKIRLLAPVVADDFNIVPHGNNGGFTIVVVKAA